MKEGERCWILDGKWFLVYVFFSILTLSTELKPGQARHHEVGAQLGERPISTCVLRVSAGPNEGRLLAAVRLQKAQGLSSDEVSDVVSCARILAQTPDANLALMMDPIISDDEVLIVSEFVDGESLADLRRQVLASGSRPPLEVWLRVLLDVLSGLRVLHAVRNRDGQPAGFFHGEVTPSTVIVGVDGVSRLIHTCRIPGLCFKVPGAHSTMAPELLLQESDVDFRADLYSVGVMLWEAVSGRPLFSTDKPSAIIRELLAGVLPLAQTSPDTPWAPTLVPVVARALAIDRTGRYPNAQSMCSDLESHAEGHVASHIEVSRWVCSLAGDRMVARRKRHGGHDLVLPVHTLVDPVPLPSASLPSPIPGPAPVPLPALALPPVVPEKSTRELLATSVPEPSEPRNVPAPLFGPSATHSGAESRKRPWLWIAGVAVATLAFLGAFLIWSLREGGDEQDEHKVEEGQQAAMESKDEVGSPPTFDDDSIPKPEGLDEPSAIGAELAPEEPLDEAQPQPAPGMGADPADPLPTPPKPRKPKRHYDPLGI